MASSALFFVLSFLLCFSPTFSSPLVLSLTHSSSTSHHPTPHHLLKSSAARSSARFHRRQVSLPLSSGSDYTLSLSLPTSPPHRLSLFMDTVSDLVWFPCSPFQCILCDGESSSLPAPPLPLSSAVSCDSPACSAAHSSSRSDLCAVAGCPLDLIETSDCSSSNFSCPPFYYAYADGSLVARLLRHPLSLTPSLLLPDFTFGCAHSALAEPLGVAGFGPGLLSLPAQLSSLSPHLGRRFSYCLVSHSFNSDRLKTPSPLILGRNIKTDFVYTPMIANPKHPYFYSVALAGISLGRRTIPAPEFLRRVDRRGGGGMVVDSGTTFTMLPAALYDPVVAEFDRRLGRVHRRATAIEETTGLRPCYRFDDSEAVVVPVMTLHFAGGGKNDSSYSSVVLPRRNYFYEFVDGSDGGRRKVGCLMVMNGGDEEELRGGPGGTLGNYQQQGFEVAYDLENRRVGFARRQCSSLWDSLN